MNRVGITMSWLFLSLAILLEVFGSAMLKMSEGFSKLGFSLAFAISYGISFYLFSLVLKEIPLGTAYAVWAGVGLVLTAIVSVLFFGQKTDLMGIIGILFILTGVIFLNVFSKMGGH